LSARQDLNTSPQLVVTVEVASNHDNKARATALPHTSYCGVE
jgi:hypothetical protein